MSFKLDKPYTDRQYADFIVKYNHQQGLTIKETEKSLYALEAWEKLEGDTVIDDSEGYKEKKASEQRNYLIEKVNYPLKAKVAYTGVIFDYNDEELVFETNETSISMINFTAMMSQQAGLTNISNWKCRRTIEPFEPVSVTFTMEQFQQLLTFATQMVLQAFVVEEEINKQIQEMTTEQLNDIMFIEEFKKQMEKAYGDIQIKIENLFSTPRFYD